MESLENLREFVSKGSRTQITTLPPVDLITLDLNDLTKLIDAIEEEHEETARALYKSGVEYGLEQGFADLDLLLDHQQEKLAEHGYVKLPVDADGEVIRVGDMMKRERDGYMAEVAMLGLNVWGWYVNHGKYTPSELRHHHEPTVEEILRDYATRILIAGCIDEEDELVAKYAKKLRLAESYREDLLAANWRVHASYNDGFDDGFASADDWLGQHEDAMAEHGWVKLPVDADGVPIRVGDLMEGEKIGGGFCEPFEVVGYIMCNGELEPMDNHRLARKRKYSHHHHEPDTWERIIEDACKRAVDGYPEETGYIAMADLVERCKVLAGDGE